MFYLPFLMLRSAYESIRISQFYFYVQLTKAHVSRRYKHFDWLYCRLVAKYPCVRIPPLPEKAITGKYVCVCLRE